MALDPSFEKLSHARSGSQIAIWNEGKSWAGPLQYYSRLSAAIRTTAVQPTRPEAALPPIDASDADRRLLFFRWEVEALIANRIDETDSSIELLNVVFFDALGFKGTAHHRGSDRPLPTLDVVLARRCAPPALMGILYAWIGEIIFKCFESRNLESTFARIELVQSTPTEVVRVIPSRDRGEVWLIDLERRGAKVDEGSWSEWCSSSPDGFQKLTWAQGTIRALTELFHSFDAGPTPTLDTLTSQLFVLDQIMSLYPSDTRRWADRARLNARRGDNSGALDDLKRFFAFHDRDSAPTSIVALYDTLRN